jgi:polysaccharide pyruvyl transferase WcaK-like protein
LKVLLTGYYGRANFGDDILLLVSYALARRQWPEARIAIRCHAPVGDYFGKLLGDDGFEVVRPGEYCRYDVEILGGGGLFFDFAAGSGARRALNWILSRAGSRPYALLVSSLRRMARRSDATRVRVGWGVGVGRYAHGSHRLRHDLPKLATLDALMVRDAQSAGNLAGLGLSLRTIVGSDIAFIRELWAPRPLRAEREAGDGRQRLGLVLRDWPPDASAYLARVRELLPELARRFRVSFFLMDEGTDHASRELAQGFETHVWRPQATSVEAFSAALSAQDVLFTSRAHGAICGAVLGVPSLLVPLEPKLATVHAMLPGSTVLADAQLAPGPVLRALEQLAGEGRVPSEGEAEANRAAALAGVAEIFRSVEARLHG